jgi:hypothetical protein
VTSSFTLIGSSLNAFSEKAALLIDFPLKRTQNQTAQCYPGGYIWGRMVLVVFDPGQIVGSNMKRRQVAKDRYG